VAHKVCPWWLGYGLVSPIRRVLEPPRSLLAPHVAPGMVVVEPGCGMGFFTIELARMVGPTGKVIAVDVQPRMLTGLRRRLRRTGLADRIDIRLADAGALHLDDLAGTADLAVAVRVVHEVDEPRGFFAELRAVLKPDGRILVVEPRRRVTAAEFEGQIQAAAAVGFVVAHRFAYHSDPAVLLQRPSGVS
jgi:ubiquinone/menaquinone biosynthesis C-methylase UbiE